MIDTKETERDKIHQAFLAFNKSMDKVFKLKDTHEKGEIVKHLRTARRYLEYHRDRNGFS